MKFMILDGNSIINRAFFGVRMLTTKDGLCTNAIFGFLNILERLQNEEKPDALAVAFDVHAPTFRHLSYEGYKATRHAMPEELCMQMPLMKDVLRAMNIPIFECAGWEADDILGTAGRVCTERGWDCVIVTGDRDSLQLIDDHVFIKLITTKQGQTLTTLYDRPLFEAEYGLEPKRLIDLKSLMGDSSDNIPGVAGIGPKTATQLLQNYGTLDGIYENLENIKETVRRKLEEHKAEAYLSYELATIVPQAPVDLDPGACRVQSYNEAALYDIFLKLEFTKFIDRYHLHPGKKEATVQENFFTDVQEPSDKIEAMQALSAMSCAPFVCLWCDWEKEKIAVQFDNRTVIFSTQALGEDFPEISKALFSAQVKKVCHDAKTLMRVLLEKNYPIDGFIFDVALAAYVLDATQGSYDLERLTVSYCNFELKKSDEDEGDEALAAKASAVAALYAVLPQKLTEQGTDKLYFEIELPLCPVLARMEKAGVLVDQMALIAFGNLLSGRIAECETQIFDFAGKKFNINSPKQLGEVLFETLGLPVVKKTKSGYSTNADVLEKLRDKHPIVQAVLDFRTLSKLKSTYADGLVKEIADDGRIHTTFQNMVTATGRLSSTEPNLQNIPVRTELGSEIRKMFIPADGCVLVDADYSQIELRILSHIADDKNMQAAFLSGQDIHTATAAQVFRVAPEEVTPLMRRRAKAVNFGIVYGISEFSLAEDIGVSRKEAKEYIGSYLEHFSGVRQYMKNIVEKAKADGFVSTVYGRRRILPELKSSNFQLRAFGERVALNAPIQGTAADIMKLAMVRVDSALRERKLRARLVLQVHDELIVECPADEAETVRKLVAEQMQAAGDMKVPLLTEAKFGASWYEAK